MAVQASRLSTSLHQVSSPGQPISPEHQYHGILGTFCSGGCKLILLGCYFFNSRTATFQNCQSIGCHGDSRIIDFSLCDSSSTWRPHLLNTSIYFILRTRSNSAGKHCMILKYRYIKVFYAQVLILLTVAYWMVHILWRRSCDPDNYAIPYLTAMGDLLGTGLLAVVWLMLWQIGDKDEDVGD